MNLALVGFGFMGATHLQALGQVPSARVAGVVTRGARKLADGLPCLTLDAALADASIDAVDICLPTHLHARVAINALRAGKHVLVEKPMALDAPSARAMAAEAECQGRILMIAHVLRFWPAYVALREAVRGNQFGRVRHARFERRSAVPGWGPWLLDPALSGGGAFDLLIHDVDMCLHLFGRPSAVAAVRYAELLDAQLYYPDMVAHISGGWQHAGAFPFRMEYTVTFEGATAEYSSIGRPAMLYSAKETRPLEPSVSDAAGDPRGDAYAAEIAYFADCCHTGRAPELCPPRESADAVALALLLLQAGRRNGEKIECTI
ncbi:MAG: Gfo/Idh/MocA family protein [Bryobacteraceae bacterium]